MEYKVLYVDTQEGEDPGDLKKIVETGLAEGWRPQGGIAVCSYETIEEDDTTLIQFIWAQAMIRPAAAVPSLAGIAALEKELCQP